MAATVKLTLPEYYGDVDVTGGYADLPDETHTLRRAKLLSNGETLVLMQRDEDSRRYRQFDRIVEASIEEAGRNRYHISGMSERLTGDPQFLSGEDAMVSWTFTVKPCASC